MRRTNLPGTFCQRALPVQHGVANFQAFRQTEAEPALVLPRLENAFAAQTHSTVSSAQKLRRRTARDRLHGRRLVSDHHQTRGAHQT